MEIYFVNNAKRRLVLEGNRIFFIVQKLVLLITLFTATALSFNFFPALCFGFFFFLIQNAFFFFEKKSHKILNIYNKSKRTIIFISVIKAVNNRLMTKWSWKIHGMVTMQRGHKLGNVFNSYVVVAEFLCMSPAVANHGYIKGSLEPSSCWATMSSRSSIQC